MRKLIIGILLISTMFCANAQDKSKDIKYTVMYYNLENLFDTENDPAINDEEFLPDGTKKWTEQKYQKKLANMSKVLYSIASAQKAYPTIIGVSEIENRRVVEDLISQESLLRGNYQIVHYDSPDLRGIDVALLYRPDQFTYEGSESFKLVVPERPDFLTRDILATWGKIEGELFCFYVTHLPSRRGGQYGSAYLRNAGAASIKQHADSMKVVYPDIKIVIMGDMNDNPTDPSLYEVLGASVEEPSDVAEGAFFNPYLKMYRQGYGTTAYQDEWSIFDNIIVSESLINKGELRLLPSVTSDKYYGNIFKRPFMVQKRGQYKNYPQRTFSSNNFMNGFSDHYPVFIMIGK